MTIIIVGKTGSGKSKTAKKLESKYGFKVIVTDTTRPIRDNEVDGVDYNFLTDEKFLELEKSGYYIETKSYNAAFGFCRYGTPKKVFEDNGENKVIVMSPNGVRDVYGKLDDNTEIVYLDVSDDIIIDRLRRRGDSMEEVYRRLLKDSKDFYNLEDYSSLTLVVDKGMSVDDVADMIYNVCVNVD